ncbi:hypothetical protein ACHAWF_001378 [Thalassiosira exigua]
MKSPPALLVLWTLLLPATVAAFVAPRSSRAISPSASASASASASRLAAKKKKKGRSTAGEGFGKSPPAVVEEAEAIAVAEAPAARGDDGPPRPLASADDAISSRSPAEELDLDPNLSDEARSKAILQRKFGLKSYEEQQADAGDYRALLDSEEKAKKRSKLRSWEEAWPEDEDFVSVLPPALIKGVDGFLKAGLGASTVAFVSAGLLITVEAGYKSTGTEMPGDLERFVVDVVEPNFTPGLGVLLGFSVGLGLFSVALGGSASSSYREDP